MIFGSLITGYLFLGGAGAGFLVALSLLELITLRQIRRQKLSGSERSPDCPREFFALCWPFCLAILFFAVLCLLVDLGRVDRVLNLIRTPSLSALTVGSYSLVFAIACSALFVFIRVFGIVAVPRQLLQVLSVLGIVTGFVTAAYTGVLLKSLASVLFWNSTLLPLLFLLSALSTGIACVLLSAQFTNTRTPLYRIIKKLVWVDMTLIVLELLSLGTYLLVAYLDSTTTATAHALLMGDLRWVFWVGLVLCGLVLPLVLEAYLSASNYRRQILWIAPLVLIGGLVLRICIVVAASYDITQSSPMIYYGLGL